MTTGSAMYGERQYQDSDGLWTYEYLSASGAYMIAGMTSSQACALCDEIDTAEHAQVAWESVLQRWAQGYRRDTKP